MNILVAPDSFKGSLTALQAADAIVQGVRDVLPDAEIVSIPVADGGEGTVDALVMATGGRILREKVTGPMGDPVEAAFGVLGDDVTGVIEMAQAAGLSLVPVERRNPLLATTYGVGELMRAALDAGCTRLIVGLGGSATSDGGAGMAQALGVRLLAADGRELKRGAAALMGLDRIDLGGGGVALDRIEHRGEHEPHHRARRGDADELVVELFVLAELSPDRVDGDDVEGRLGIREDDAPGADGRGMDVRIVVERMRIRVRRVVLPDVVEDDEVSLAFG